MHGARSTRVDSGIVKGSWSEIFRNGLGLYSALVIGGIAMNATQMLVIAIIMPTIVHDIGGASFYTWAAMLYTIGSIVGGASTGMVWSRLGARRAYTLGAAFAGRREKTEGSIEAGKLADFIVLDRDLFKIEPSEIGKTEVLLTMVGGKVVYESPNWTHSTSADKK